VCHTFCSWFSLQFLRHCRDHPNIVRLFGWSRAPDEDRGRVECLVLEYLEQGSLLSQLSSPQGRNLLTAAHRINIMLGVAKALCFMHNGNVGGRSFLHRDIKSANICLTNGFQPKLIDFGFVKLVGPTSENDNWLRCFALTDSFRCGTRGYICPEYERRTSYEYDVLCEAFSFGVVMLELIAGRVQPGQRGHSFQNGERDLARRYLVTGNVKQGQGDHAGFDKALLRGEVDLVYGGATAAAVETISTLAFQCVDRAPLNRPNFNQIVAGLEAIPPLAV
jgi:serine/threonine protein kinase